MRPDTLPTWEQLEDAASGCVRCGLHQGRTQVVFAGGDPASDLVIIGEAPGRHEDLTGEPFAGAVGNLLDNLLLDNDLTRDDVYLTTVVKCRPTHGRGPSSDEVETCAPYLRAQLDLVQPTVVVALGRTVAELLLGREAPIHRLAGHRLSLGGVTLIATYDPNTALQGNGRAMTALRRDVRTAAGILSGRVAAAEGALAELRTERPTPAS